MSLRDHLQDIYEQHGRLTAELVVEAARPKAHPLHARVFDQDKSEAAESWYRHRAHELIRSVRVVYKDADETGPQRDVRAFHSVPDAEGFAFQPYDKVSVDPLMRQMVLRSMEREWNTLFSRYKEFEEFLALVAGDVDGQKAA